MKDIRTYTKSQLKELTPNFLSNIDSEIPITTPRIQSFINNPNINDNDILLIAYYKNEKLAAYFGILPDFAANGEKFYWNSGWRANNAIDKRAASIVFYKALNLYGNNMMLNHLTPHTRQLIDSTKIFENVKKLKGNKFFIKSVFSEIIIAKNKKFKLIKPLLCFSDIILNSLISIKKKPKSDNIKLEIYKNIDKESEEFINTIKNEFVQNSVSNINNAIKNKWLVTDNSFKIENNKYFFSLQTKIFENYILKFSYNGHIIGILHIVNRDNNFKLYYSYINNEYSEQIATETYLFLHKNNAKTFLSFDIELNFYLTKLKYLFVKDTVQYYTFSKQISYYFNNNQKYQAGFGDVLYT